MCILYLYKHCVEAIYFLLMHSKIKVSCKNNFHSVNNNRIKRSLNFTYHILWKINLSWQMKCSFYQALKLLQHSWHLGDWIGLFLLFIGISTFMGYSKYDFSLSLSHTHTHTHTHIYLYLYIYIYIYIYN